MHVAVLDDIVTAQTFPKMNNVIDLLPKISILLCSLRVIYSFMFSFSRCQNFQVLYTCKNDTVLEFTFRCHDG